MMKFSFQIGEVTSLYHRVLNGKDLSVKAEPEKAELKDKDIVNISAAAKRQNIFEETQSAVLSRIKAK